MESPRAVSGGHTGAVDNGVGDFLRSRRARLTPEQAGIAQFDENRRVVGLRREEMAQLASVSVDYYMRLEQGRARNVSESVLNAVSEALKLTPTERQHLANLARPTREVDEPAEDPTQAPVRRLLEMMTGVPALVLGRSMQALAWNPLAHAVFGLEDIPVGHLNIARVAFSSLPLRQRLRNSAELDAQVVAYLRLQVGRHPHDSELLALIGELLNSSAEFARLWPVQDVRDGRPTVVNIAHPVVGDLELTNLWLTLPGNPDHILVAYTVAAGSVSQQRLDRLHQLLQHPV